MAKNPESSWEIEFDEEFTREDGLINKYSFYPDGEEKSTPDALKLFITKVLSTARKEERQFILNILDGIDEADRQMGNKGGGTKAIRFALKSRLIE